MSSVDEVYKKLKPKEHIKLRPDTFIGSTELELRRDFVWDSVQQRMVYRPVFVVPGLFKIFDEILVNSCDNKQRDPQGTTLLKCDIDQQHNRITIYNNGAGIPVEVHHKITAEHRHETGEDREIYAPEAVFGHLSTSSNFEDTVKRTVGGRNGYGAKLTNIFSREFTVTIVDQKNRLKYVQTWRNNMDVCEKPVITQTKESEKSSVQVSFVPDFQYFGNNEIDLSEMQEVFGLKDLDLVEVSAGRYRGDENKVFDRLTDDMVALLQKRVYDAAGTTAKTLKVKLNGKILKSDNFKKYTELYLAPDQSLSSSNEAASDSSHASADDPSEESSTTTTTTTSTADNNSMKKKKPSYAYLKVNDRWEVVVAPTNTDAYEENIGFVNNIACSQGEHMKYVREQITKPIVAALKKKHKDVKIQSSYVSNHLRVFVNAIIENPRFDSQCKENLKSKRSTFGSKCNVPETFIKKILKTDIMKDIEEYIHFQNQKGMKKSDGSATKRTLIIPKLDDANFAGHPSKAKDCTLILTEGDSAKALAVAGLSVVGRDYYGVFPLKGKMLNVRNASCKSITENAEVSNLKKILGLKSNKIYTDATQLRYGHVIIMADQDVDGSHIKGLVMNMFEFLWPSLLQVPGFLKQFITPIVRCTHRRRKKEIVNFYSLPKYEKWCQSHELKDWTIKYYKGLGTSTSKDARKYFSNLDFHVIDFNYEVQRDTDMVSLAFDKKKSDLRKELILAHDPEIHVLNFEGMDEISCTDFIVKELIQFDMYDNYRAIPSVVDGLKPGQRKVLFSCFKRNLTKEVKVSQLAGYVSENSAYHHGEASLVATIVKMAQNYINSNNINLLMPNGQFGTRLQNGEDSASGRYIFTRLSDITRSIFHPDDDHLLKYLQDDAQMVEPNYYVPVVPMILINGSNGIGTGWSSNIPNYNPRDVLQEIRHRLNDPEYQFKPLKPWYRNFRGLIEPNPNGGFVCVGHIERITVNILRIAEIPCGKATYDYRDFLKKLLKDGAKPFHELSEVRDNFTNSTICFDLKFKSAAALERLLKCKTLYKKLKLEKNISVTNFMLHDADGRIKHYKNTQHIMEDFYKVRYELYVKRQAYLIAQLQDELNILENKRRFVSEIVNEKLEVRKVPKNQLEIELERREYLKVKTGAKNDTANYDYLLRMPIWSLTQERILDIEHSARQCQEKLTQIQKKTIKDFWMADLNQFEEQLNKQDQADRDEIKENIAEFKKKRKKKPLSASKKGRKRKPIDDLQQYDPKKKAKRFTKANDVVDIEDVFTINQGQYVVPRLPVLKVKKKGKKQKVSVNTAAPEVEAPPALEEMVVD